MKKLGTTLIILALVSIVSADLGISPAFIELEIKTNEQRIQPFMISNGGNSPIEVTLSSTVDFIKPKVEKITVQPKKDAAVEFIISPLQTGEYYPKVLAKTTASATTGLGFSEEIGAALKIHVSKEYDSHQQTTLSEACGDGKCYFSEIETCPQDCKKVEKPPSVDYIIFIPVILVILIGAFVYWKGYYY